MELTDTTIQYTTTAIKRIDDSLANNEETIKCYNIYCIILLKKDLKNIKRANLIYILSSRPTALRDHRTLAYRAT